MLPTFMTADELQLLVRLERAAQEVADGHLTILRFTTNWRVGFVTPEEREDIDALPKGSTFREAATRALASVGRGSA